jgi:ACS family hexuronate transporter-like MFS transporter
MLNQYHRSRWGILALLFLSIAVNLLDRQVLSVMAPLIRQELSISNTQYSYILMSFMLGLMLAQVPAGLWIDRKGARTGLPAIMAVWSIANALHSIARGVADFAAFRFLLGAGECGNYSAGVKVIAQRFPPQERALAGGLFNCGTVIGSLVAPAIVVVIAGKYGWRASFLLPSLLGLLWIVPWLLLYRDAPASTASTTQRVSFRPLLAYRQVWGMMLIRGLAGPVIHFYWYWLPEYLRSERHFSMEMIGAWAGIPFLFAGFGNIAGGWFAGSLMKRGWSADRTRKTGFVIGGLLCGAAVLVPLATSEMAAIALICLASFGLSTMVANNIGLLGDLFHPKVLAGVTGLTGMAEGLCNIVLTLATGIVVDRFSYLPVFVAAGLMPSLAVLALFFLIRRVEPV